MAKRTLRPKHSDEIRAKIQASVLIGLLSDHVQGKRDLSATQIRSAEILLKKSVPDLSAVEMSTAADSPFVVQVTSYAERKP